MKFIKSWAPAIIMMAAIFTFSSIPSEDMPSFGGFDFSIKKFGHAFGYALLALAYQRGLKHTVQVQGSSISSILHKYRSLVAWFLAILFAVTDEFHQSFVPGRNPSIWDILLFDNGGAILGLLINNLLAKKVKN